MLADNHQIAHLVTCFSARPGVVSEAEKQIAAGEMTLEMLPQGTLVERMRAGGAGLPRRRFEVARDRALSLGIPAKKLICRASQRRRRSFGPGSRSSGVGDRVGGGGFGPIAPNFATISPDIRMRDEGR